jgi:histidine triad (HIT) family protein
MNNNIFAKILRGEIPCNKIYEDDFVLSFHDINPQKKIHALVFQKENILILMILV